VQKFTLHQILRIPCEVRPGAFSTEYLITVRTGEQTVSGFIKKNEVESVRDGKGFIRGKVIKVEKNSITVQFPGSFFTTAAGVASVSSGWASQNFQLAAA
jgi:hypothetical protein